MMTILIKPVMIVWNDFSFSQNEEIYMVCMEQNSIEFLNLPGFFQWQNRLADLFYCRLANCRQFCCARSMPFPRHYGGSS